MVELLLQAAECFLDSLNRIEVFKGWKSTCKTERPVRVSNKQGQELWNQLYLQWIFNRESHPHQGSPIYGNMPWLLLANLTASHYVSHPASTALIVLWKSRHEELARVTRHGNGTNCHATITIHPTCKKIREKEIKGEDRSWGDWMIVVGMKMQGKKTHKE